MAETVRERLERLKNQPSTPFRPNYQPVEERPRQEQPKPFSPENLFMKKVEKVMNDIDILRKKMFSDSGQYLSLYYDYKKKEKEFLDIVESTETKNIDLPDFFVTRLEEFGTRLKSKK